MNTAAAKVSARRSNFGESYTRAIALFIEQSARYIFTRHASNSHCTLRWETHIDYIMSKAVSRLYFLKQLKRAGLPSSHLSHFYITVIRPILEYASPLWHPTLTKSQAERLEAVQRRAINIIFGYSSPTPYFAILALAGIPSLQARRLDLSKRFFRKICQPTSCLHHLLPPPRDPAVTSRLRKSTLYPRPILRTKRYCSTINYALLNSNSLA